jgi:predicted ArsR family transcriptional regulator
MRNSNKLDYIAKHRKIRDRLIILSRTSKYACFTVAQLASELKMDVRTVRAHLEIMEIDGAGTFMDVGKKQFCTKKGITFLADLISEQERQG